MTYFNNYSTEFIRVTGEVCGSARGIEAEQLSLHRQGPMTAGGAWKTVPTTATMNESPSFNFVGLFGVEEQWTYLSLLWAMVCTWVSTACAPAWHVAFTLAASTGVAAEIVWNALINLCPCSPMLAAAFTAAFFKARAVLLSLARDCSKEGTRPIKVIAASRQATDKKLSLIQVCTLDPTTGWGL